jgi:hypothetical protein
MRQHTSAYAVVWRVPQLLHRQRHLYIYIAHVSTRQHTSAYVSIRQHTSAYVSIRERMRTYEVRDARHKRVVRVNEPAYVSIRQHT